MAAFLEPIPGRSAGAPQELTTMAASPTAAIPTNSILIFIPQPYRKI
jgi:hypothetical protein